MSLTRTEKAEILAKLTENFKAAKAVAFGGYQGITVKDMEELRRKLRESGARYVISKKTLIKAAARKAGLPDIPDEALPGQIGVAFGFEDEIAPARVLYTFGKTHEQVQLFGGMMDGKMMSVSEVKYFATLPSKEELLAQLVYMFNSPIAGFHGVLHAVLRNFVGVLSAVEKERAKNAPAPVAIPVEEPAQAEAPAAESAPAEPEKPEEGTPPTA